MLLPLSVRFGAIYKIEQLSMGEDDSVCNVDLH